MKKCPYCTAEIPDEALKCQHCGEWVSKPSAKALPSTKELEGRSVGEALNRIVDLGEQRVPRIFKTALTLMIVMTVVGLTIFLIFFFAFFLPMWHKAGGL